MQEKVYELKILKLKFIKSKPFIYKFKHVIVDHPLLSM